MKFTNLPVKSVWLWELIATTGYKSQTIKGVLAHKKTSCIDYRNNYQLFLPTMQNFTY